MYSYRSLVIFFLLAAVTLGQQSFEDFMRSQQKDFDEYKKSLDEEYADYKAKEEAAFKKFKKDVELQWQEFKGSTSKMYVSYDKDLQSRGAIDYDHGEVVIEVIINNDELDDESLNYKDSALDRFVSNGHSPFKGYLFILKSFFFPMSPQTADHIDKQFGLSNKDPVLQKVAQNKLFLKLVDLLSEKDESGNSLLENQFFDKNGKPVKDGVNSKGFAAEKVIKSDKNVKTYVGKDGKNRTSVSLKVPLRLDHKKVRSNKYGKEILKQSKRFNIDPSIAMAIAETESAFNPKATSHIPAYGLMQLVPSSGGRDAYQYVYGKDKFLDKNYLYKPNNNIELGCAYLGKILHQYFKGVRNQEMAYMCTVAAYNTGAGNVSKALTNDTKLRPAISKVNRMSSGSELYNTLINDLEYDETRNYLKKVWERKNKYRS
ncbi:MAG: hypothetical protein CMG60_01540 [Candidatus Marinimicrobia bacterium]|nr:hypothetical protein [Candidatus Neomarinimicrobiota bacterium]